MTNRLARLLQTNGAQARAPRLVLGYDPDWDGDDDAGDPNLVRDPNAREATLWVYDAIGGWFGVDGGGLAREIASLDVDTIHIRLNSPGGDVFDARVLKTALENSKARVVAHVDALAASAASFLMLAADEIEIAPGAFVMIHNPWSMVMGEAGDMRQAADMLDKVGQTIAADYAAKTGMSRDEALALMAAETWLDADEAVARGFCDRLMAKAPKASARFDLSAFDRVPDKLTNPPPPPAPPPEDPFAALASARAAQERRLAVYERLAL